MCVCVCACVSVFVCLCGVCVCACVCVYVVVVVVVLYVHKHGCRLCSVIFLSNIFLSGWHIKKHHAIIFLQNCFFVKKMSTR